MSFIERYTPYMSEYSEAFSDSGKINWLPYLMYFHPPYYQSDVINTDGGGFRYSEALGSSYSVKDLKSENSVRILAGSSTVFGIGASSDKHTLSSRMTENDPRGECWVNFGGRSFNSTQEVILFSLNYQSLPNVKEIVLFSGFNDLGLARLPESLRLDHGAFFMCRDFFRSMKANKKPLFYQWFKKNHDENEKTTSLEEQMDYAAKITLKNLKTWKALAQSMGAELTFVLQPLSNWVRETGSKEEQEIFSELEINGNFKDMYGDILTQESFKKYVVKLEEGTKKESINFINMAPIIKSNTVQSDWLFVDRIHFTDYGHDVVSKLLLKELFNKGVEL